MQGAIYCGVPAANTAFKITGEILRAEGRAPAPRSLAADFARRDAPHLQRAAAARHGAGRRAPAGRAEPCARPRPAHVGRARRRAWRRRTPCCATTSAATATRRGRPGPYTMDDLVDDAARADPRMGPRAGRLDRPVDGRHGRPGARRSPPRAAARRSSSPTPPRAIPRRRGRRGRRGSPRSSRAAWRRSPMPSSSATCTPTIAPRIPRSPPRCAPALLRTDPAAYVAVLPRGRQRRLARPAGDGAPADARHRRRARRRRDAGDGAGDRRADRRRRAARLRRRLAPERGRGRRRIPRRGIVVPRLAAAALTARPRAPTSTDTSHEQSIRLPGRPRRQEGHLHQALRQRLRVHRRGRPEHRRRHRRRRGDGDRHAGHAGDGARTSSAASAR